MTRPDPSLDGLRPREHTNEDTVSMRAGGRNALDYFREMNREYQGRGVWHLSDQECNRLIAAGQLLSAQTLKSVPSVDLTQDRGASKS